MVGRFRWFVWIRTWETTWAWWGGPTNTWAIAIKPSITLNWGTTIYWVIFWRSQHDWGDWLRLIINREIEIIVEIRFN